MKTSMHKNDSSRRPDTRSWLHASRGSALILTLLVLLVLTGLGMTAMHSVGVSLQQSGAYRVRAQASGLANAAVLYTSSQAGKSAQHYWTQMNRQQNAAFADISSGSRIDTARRGAYLHLAQPQSGTRAFKDIDITGVVGTGLLAVNDQTNSFEADSRGTQKSQFSSVIRDPMDGPAAPGAGESSCYKRVTVASQAMLGDPADTVTGAGMVGNKRAVLETYIGPIDCGAR
ncbi:hypothetical protein [Bradymonas sediminis]|uniref:hypothetical protein n=1 Tax=Bradymonas sediminis TaxID=1548548 RepID=UPI00105E592D|nr:hypothetical protein [Bradymonas sediminis]TDP75472.1 hypothetical protein DFR33_104340 [Bradymonas sediminis]